jgi:exodeoxyribonuclease VII small subunit
MSGYVNLPPGGPAGGFDAPATQGAVQARAGFYPAAPAGLPQSGAAVRASRQLWRLDTMTPAPAQARASKIADRPLPPTMPRSSPHTAPEPASYEQSLAELEALVQAMEAGKMPLDQLLSSYKRGAELLQQCRARLQGVEDQVKVLEDGQLKPWTSA